MNDLNKNNKDMPVKDFDENEYFIDDIREAVFTQIYEAVVELTKQ